MTDTLQVCCAALFLEHAQKRVWRCNEDIAAVDKIDLKNSRGGMTVAQLLLLFLFVRKFEPRACLGSLFRKWRPT